jgi:NAD(P)-dependent dehydrogenase (short-subunit alcohol dehydrogenase family)
VSSLSGKSIVVTGGSSGRIAQAGLSQSGVGL